MKMPSRAVLSRIGWAFGVHGSLQFIRLATSVVLTRLLAPEIFGLMLIVNTLRTGIELLSDIGISQNIISSKRGEDPAFLDTAWTLQILRGGVLFVIFALAAWPIAAFYDEPQLALIIAASSLGLIITSFQSVSKFVVQRRLDLRRLAMFEVGVGIAAALSQIALSMVWPNIWSLVAGFLISAAMGTVASFYLVPELKMRIRFSLPEVHEILRFGRWILLSSLLYFAATNFDRLYLGTAIPFALLGIYGIARSLAEVLGTLVVRVGNMVVFPAVAASRDDRHELKRKLMHARLPLLAAAAVGLGLFVSVSDVIVYVLYDSRYYLAAQLVPILGAGVWFTILATMAESTLLGIGKPIYGTVASLAKFVWLVVALPVGVSAFGVMGAAAALALADAIRFAPMVVAQRIEGFSTIRQDVALTILFVVSAMLFRELGHLAGLTEGLTGWLIPVGGLGR